MEALQFCPECGKQILVQEQEQNPDNGEHSKCINWGIWLKKYKNAGDWVIACKKNGERVYETGALG
jgi:hypothetical protein